MALRWLPYRTYDSVKGSGLQVADAAKCDQLRSLAGPPALIRRRRATKHDPPSALTGLIRPSPPDPETICPRPSRHDSLSSSPARSALVPCTSCQCMIRRRVLARPANLVITGAEPPAGPAAC